MKALFYHGGPGLNSNPEKNMLTQKFKAQGIDLHCWDEPSVLRPREAMEDSSSGFKAYLNSAEQFFLRHYDGTPLIVIGHSFGAQAIVHLTNRHTDKLNAVVLVASNLVPHQTDLNTFSFIAADLEQHDPEKSNLLRQIIKNYTGHFDENTQKGFSIVADNPRLFDYYWHNQPAMQQYLSYYTSPEYVMDVAGYFAVRNTWYQQPIHKIDIPTLAIYGKHDVVVSNDAERQIVSDHFQNVTFHEFEHAAHYPHVEEADLLLDKLKHKLN